jgi:hypothetical protein
MTVTKEIVSLEGILKGDGQQRKCRVKAVRHTTYADECPTPTCLSYSRCDIEDTDELPDGNYELEFDGHRVSLIRTAGQYVPCFGEQSIAWSTT